MRFLRLRSVALLLLLAFAVGISIGTAHAVDVNARIRGTVTDPSGAVIPGAAVTATNTATGVKYPTKSNSTGDYLLPQLPVGTYSISATAPGFKTFTATGIVLTIDQEYVEPVKLEVGSKGEAIEVAADAVQVNTTDMQLNNIVNSTQMVELPLIGRNFTGLELAEPGVQASSDRFGTYSVSGSQTQQSEFLVNGADTNDIALNTLAIAPNLDAIDQFNLVEGPLNAEYDRNSGGIVSATIKQGTNHFHGDAFEFYRDTFLNTNDFFQKSVTGSYVPVTPYHQNIFGGTIGGPIFRDKLFFFGAYQGIHQRVPDNTSNALPSTLNRSGNFADIAGPALSAAPLVTSSGCENSTAGNPLPGTPDWGEFSGCDLVPQTILSQLPNCTSGMYWSQCAYAYGANFPTTTFNPIAAKLLASIPTPNSGTYGYVFNSTTTTSSNQYIGRLDYSLNPANQFYGVGIFFKSNVADTIPFTGATLPGYGDKDLETIQQYTFDYVHQFNSTAVNDFAIHWTRFNYQAVEPQNTVSPSSLGFSINAQDTAAQNVPTIAVGGNNTSFTLGFSTNGPQPRIDQVYQLDDNITKTIGHHTLKFGYDGRRFNVSNPFYADNSGDFNFDSNSGSSGNNSSFSSGDGTVDFLLGVPGGYAQGSGATIQADAFLNYMFAQDSWRVTNTLTFNYGLGYSIDTPLHNNQYQGEGIACLNPGEQSKIFPTAPLGVTYPGDPGCTNSGKAYTRFSEFGPRIGFAWAPDLGRISGSPGKFSIRAGFGIYYDRTEEESSLQTLETTPFGATSSGAGDFTGVPQFANPFADVNNGYKANCYPGGIDPSTGGPCVQGTVSESNKFPYTFPTRGQALSPSEWNPVYEISTYDSTFRAPYSENIQLSVEREFPSRIVTRLSYVGSLAHHNQITYEGNPTTAAGQAACAAGNEYSPVLGETLNCVSNAGAENLYWPNNTAYGSIYAPTGYPGFTGFGEVGSESSSSYNGLEASVTKATTHGLNFQLSYTYAHALDNGSSFENSGFGGSNGRGYNQYDQALNYGNSAYDARQRLVFAPVYISPILHGHSTFAPVNLALSGWEVSAITTVATGFPYDISYGGGSARSLWCSIDTSFYACPDIPEQTAPLVRGANVRTRNGAGRSTWFQGSSSFAAEPIGSFGNVSRNPYHGPGINGTNLVLAKNFNLDADGVRRLQLRMESDNAFNHTQFSNPGGTYGASTFGLITGSAASRQTQLAAKFYF